jgi:CRP-like cAMP-binding protein
MHEFELVEALQKIHLRCRPSKKGASLLARRCADCSESDIPDGKSAECSREDISAVTNATLRRPEAARIRVALERSIHFRDLVTEDLDRLAGLCSLRHLRDGEPAGSEGGRRSALLVVLDGCLRVSSVDVHGNEFVYAMLGAGSFFGLGSVLSGMPTEVEAHASGDSTLATMDGAKFLALLDEHPRLWRHMATLLHRRLTLAMTSLRDISVAPLPQRIVRRLLGQAISCGNDISGEARVELRVTQSDLGRMLATSRSRINGALKRLEKDGLVKVGYRTISLVDFARLRQLAGPDVFAF